jgi:diacylglycerol O-acyltransferase / wax synthase
MPVNDQLTALDATFLELEQADDSALMHIGGALVFESLAGGGTPTIDRMREHLEQRLDLLPRYRQKLGTPRTGGLAWPSWEPDERFDIEAHTRHATLPPPGDEREFLDWISDFYSHRLDRSRPLWEMVLLDGLEDHRWALVWKTHHCLVDGVGSVDVAHLLLDSERVPSEPFGLSQVPEPTSGSEDVLRAWLPHPPEPVRQAVGVGLAAVHSTAHALMHPREALERSRAVLDLLVRNELVSAPRSSLNVPIGATRQIATVHVQLEELKAIRSALGGTVNDVVLCAATGALRELLLGRGEDPPSQGLRAMVPVNIRREGEQLGNKIASLFIDLPVAESDPLRRYAQVRRASEKRKAGGQALGTGALIGLTELAPPVLHAGLARSLYAKRLFNVTITNVPGPRNRLFAFGAPMVDVVPIVPLAADHALGIAVVSYDGELTFGLCADRAVVPDLDLFKDATLMCLLELARLAHATAAVC